MADILGNLILLGTKEDAGSWWFGDTDAQVGFPASNLGLAGFGAVWRSEISATPSLVIDRGASPPAMAGFLCAASNLRPGIDTVKLTMRTAVFPADPDYESAVEAAVITTYLGSRPHVPRWGAAFGWVFPAALASRYILVEFNTSGGGGHPDGYVELAAVTGSGYWPNIDNAAKASFDRQGEEEQPVLSGPARSGFTTLEQRFPFRAPDVLASRDLDGITRTLLEHDGRIGWVVAPLFDRSRHAPRLGYGRVKEPLLEVSPAGGGSLYRSFTLALVETSD